MKKKKVNSTFGILMANQPSHSVLAGVISAAFILLVLSVHRHYINQANGSFELNEKNRYKQELSRNAFYLIVFFFLVRIDISRMKAEQRLRIKAQSKWHKNQYLSDSSFIEEHRLAHLHRAKQRYCLLVSRPHTAPELYNTAFKHTKMI
jgi:hypothetical protein